MESKFSRRKPATGSDGAHSKPFHKASKSFHKDTKPFGKESKPFHKDSKPFGERPKKTYDGERKPFDAEHKPFRRSADSPKPFRRDSKPFGERRRKSFDAEPRSFDRNRKPTHGVLEWTPTDEFIRLNRFIANSGVCSRREADQYIQTGLVTVNGAIVTELGTKVKLTDDIRFNGERLKGEKRVYLVMNKPKGYVTTLEDPHATKIVMDLISKSECPERVYPVGRLDKATTGVLMFTNDGDLADKLMHPSFGATKIYHATLDKNLKKADFDAILSGVILEDGEIHADSLSYVDGDLAQVGIQIHSGRNRIVRRIFEHLGYSVSKLDRVYFAGLTKKALKRGAWRFLTETEVAKLKMGRFD